MQSKLAIILATFILLLSSCSREEIGNGNEANYFIKAKVDGKPFNVSHLAQALQQGGDAEKKVLKLYAANAVAPKIYPFFSCDI
jgi:hypothetical protein